MHACTIKLISLARDLRLRLRDWETRWIQAGKTQPLFSSQVLCCLIRKPFKIRSYSAIYLDSSKLNTSVATDKMYLNKSSLFCLCGLCGWTSQTYLLLIYQPFASDRHFLLGSSVLFHSHLRKKAARQWHLMLFRPAPQLLHVLSEVIHKKSWVLWCWCSWRWDTLLYAS